MGRFILWLVATWVTMATAAPKQQPGHFTPDKETWIKNLMNGAYPETDSSSYFSNMLGFNRKHPRNVPRPELRTNVTTRMPTPQCEIDYMRFVSAIFSPNVPEWASMMGDANAVPEAGTISGNNIWEGNFQQCQRLQTGLIGSDGKPMNGKYCRSMWPILTWANPAGYAVCLPSSCTVDDVFPLFQKYIQFNQLPFWYPPFESWTSNVCLEKEEKGDPAVIAASTVLAFFGLLALIGTLYDVITLKKRTKKPLKVSPDQGHDHLTDRKPFGQNDNAGFQHELSARNYPAANVVSDNTDGTTKPTAPQYQEVTYFGGPTEESEISKTGPPNGDAQHAVKVFAVDNGIGHVAFMNNGISPGKDSTNVSSPVSDKEHSTPIISEETPVYKPNTCEKIMLSFSAYTNMQKLASYDQGPGSYRAVNGIRFLAMCWIVLGHTWQLGITLSDTPSIENSVQYGILADRGSFNIIDNSNFSVETFFILSAMLTTISFMKQLRKNNNKPTCAMFGLYYFHRFWRLTPVYMLVLMAWTAYFPHLKSGPLWPQYLPGATNCRDVWWRHLIYLNNLIFDNDCMGWTWYLANDFQFYVIAPAFICLLFYVPIAGIVVTILGILGCLTSSIYTYHGVHFRGDMNWYVDWYIKPWCRSLAYLIGIFLGYLIFKTNRRPKMNKVGVVFGWLFALAAISTAIFTNWNNHPDRNQWTETEMLVCDVLSRPAFVLGVFWIIFACVTGYGGPINKLMSWTGWVVPAKLTYTGYLIHPIIIYYTYYSSPAQIVVTDWVMIYYFIGTLMLTLGISFVVSVLLEVPFLALEKVMFQKVKK